SRYPSSPGVRTYLKRAFGDRFSLFFTYLSLMVIPLIAAVEIKVFLDALLPAESSGMRLLYATGLVALLACLNLQGRDLPRLAQTAIFLALVLISLGLSSLALTQ